MVESNLETLKTLKDAFKKGYKKKKNQRNRRNQKKRLQSLILALNISHLPSLVSNSIGIIRHHTNQAPSNGITISLRNNNNRNHRPSKRPTQVKHAGATASAEEVLSSLKNAITTRKWVSMDAIPNARMVTKVLVDYVLRCAQTTSKTIHTTVRNQRVTGVEAARFKNSPVQRSTGSCSTRNVRMDTSHGAAVTARKFAQTAWKTSQPCAWRTLTRERQLAIQAARKVQYLIQFPRNATTSVSKEFHLGTCAGWIASQVPHLVEERFVSMTTSNAPMIFARRWFSHSIESERRQWTHQKARCSTPAQTSLIRNYQFAIWPNQSRLRVRCFRCLVLSVQNLRTPRRLASQDCTWVIQPQTVQSTCKWVRTTIALPTVCSSTEVAADQTPAWLCTQNAFICSAVYPF